MTDRVNRIVAAHARRLARDPTSATVDDVRKLVRTVLKLLNEPVPDEVR